jgi:hypothetical protein
VPTKRCCTCHEDLPLSAFNVRRAAPDGLQSRCRSCGAEWYVRNRVAHKQNVASRNARVRERNRVALLAYLAEHPCVDCGNDDVRVLDLDHRDPATKRIAVGRLVGWADSWERVLEEISKCDVRCANCHRQRTAADFGWARQAAWEAATARAAAASAQRLRVVLGGPAP